LEKTEPNRHGTGFTSVKVLPDLWGKKWTDEVGWGYLHSLRPSSVRFAGPGEGVKCDARDWRVTVHLGEGDIVKSITQEVQVGLYGDVENGYDLRCLEREYTRYRDACDENGNMAFVNTRAVSKVNKEELKAVAKTTAIKIQNQDGSLEDTGFRG